MIHFVTGNKSKLDKAKLNLKKFGIEIEQLELNIIEPQSNDSKFIAEYKANQAFEESQKPVIITDTQWSIPALKGFPGPYMKYINEWFEYSDFLNLMRDKTDRKIIFEDILVYKDKEQTKVFIATRIGKFVNFTSTNGISSDMIITFRKDNKTISECKELGIPSFDEDEKDSVWWQFGEWYQRNFN